VACADVDRLSSLEVAERKSDGAAAVVARSLGRIRDEVPQRRRGRIPEHLRHEPWPIAVGGGESETVTLDAFMGAPEGFGRALLKERARLLVERAPAEIARRRVAHIEAQRRIDADELDELLVAEVAFLLGRFRFERLVAQDVDRLERIDAEDVAFRGPDPPADEGDAGDDRARHAAIRVALEVDRLAVIEAAMVGEEPTVLLGASERILEEPFDERAELPVSLEDVEDVVIAGRDAAILGTVLADQLAELGRGRARGLLVRPPVATFADVDRDLAGPRASDLGSPGVRIIDPECAVALPDLGREHASPNEETILARLELDRTARLVEVDARDRSSETGIERTGVLEALGFRRFPASEEQPERVIRDALRERVRAVERRDGGHSDARVGHGRKRRREAVDRAAMPDASHAREGLDVETDAVAAISALGSRRPELLERTPGENRRAALLLRSREELQEGAEIEDRAREAARGRRAEVELRRGCDATVVAPHEASSGAGLGRVLRREGRRRHPQRREDRFGDVLGEGTFRHDLDDATRDRDGRVRVLRSRIGL